MFKYSIDNMYYYKFRLFFDDVEDFVRDIEIRSNDNFESLHNIIFSCTGLSGNELASFFICDAKWNKQKEITLIDMEDDMVADVPDYLEDDDFSTKSNIPKSVMMQSVLKEFITDPHQHIIYEYDFLNPKIFYIELMKVLPIQEGISYPRCTFKLKELPKDMSNLKLPDPENDLFEESPMDDEDDFQDGYNDDDTINLDNIEDFSQEF